MSRENEQTVAALVQLAKRYGIRSVVQVGADDGYEGRTVASHLEADYVGIEAREVEGTVRMAIGNYNGMTNFYVHKTPALSGTITRADGEETLVHIPIQRLDTFCDARGLNPDMLIIDTEGTALDVLEGAGDLLYGVKIVYAECQSHDSRPCVRTLNDVSRYLEAYGLVRHDGPPTYSVGAQGNYTWVRP